jgi:Flp pilus assembly protein TadB
MPNKEKQKLKRVNIKKERQKLIKEKRKAHPEQEINIDKKSTKKIDIRLEKETKLYWIRAITAVLSGLLGRLIFGIYGFWLFIWMLCFWFLTPFFISFIILKYQYDKEECSYYLCLLR